MLFKNRTCTFIVFSYAKWWQGWAKIIMWKYHIVCKLQAVYKYVSHGHLRSVTICNASYLSKWLKYAMEGETNYWHYFIHPITFISNLVGKWKLSWWRSQVNRKLWMNGARCSHILFAHKILSLWIICFVYLFELYISLVTNIIIPNLLVFILSMLSLYALWQFELCMEHLKINNKSSNVPNITTLSVRCPKL